MIFISYAKEDQSYAHAAFEALKKAGLDPWMDKPPAPFKHEGLQIGQKWEQVLQARLAEADYIILVLSPHSIAKRGYVQVEFRTALHRMNFLAENEVLVLPILVEMCDVPSMTVKNINLQDIQWDVVPRDALTDFASGLAKRISGGV
jgi:hypothetical protein